jgi:hypothetical protein
MAEEIINPTARQAASEDLEIWRKSPEALLAIAYCEKEISEYRSWFRWNEFRWVVFQHAAIIMGVLATVFSAVSVEQTSWWVSYLPWLRVITAAAATISAGLIGSFNYREDAVRHEMTGNALNGELAKYKTRASPYNKSEAEDTSVFTNAIVDIINSEQRDWNAQLKSSHSSASKP